VELILVDSSIQKLLRDYAVSIGEDRAWLDRIFQVGSKNPAPLIRHAKGHATHLHVRFYSPVAQETGRRAYGYLVKDGTVRGSAGFTSHVAKKGETLGSLARRYGISVQAIQQANGLRNTAIRAKTVYRIPVKGSTKPPPNAQLVVPPRRLPPASAGPPPSTAAGPQP
jgi:penicillin-insensitive murein endopeptidase